MTSQDLLTGMSFEALDALAEVMLSSASQTRLDALLERNNSSALSSIEAAELDQLLGRIDQLNLLKARARLTLSQLATASPA